MTDQIPGAADSPADLAAPGECVDCLEGRALILAVAFAAFAAFVAADLYLDGRLTAAVVGQLAALRGRAGSGDG